VCLQCEAAAAPSMQASTEAESPAPLMQGCTDVYVESTSVSACVLNEQVACTCVKLAS
jgi:hypothetical protein